MSCKRTQEFLATRGVETAELRHAKKEPVEAGAVLSVLEGVTEISVARGRKVLEIDLAADRPSDDELRNLLAPRGALRAPTLRVGSHLLVGYNLDMLESAIE